MGGRFSIGLIGDHDAGVTAHRAIPIALQRVAEARGLRLAIGWIPTEEITSPARIAAFHGLWCVPASPYRNMDGALLAIRHAREQAVPFLGTCGGFQHAVVEYARNVLGWHDATHAESTPGAGRPVVSALECALVEATAQVHLQAGSRIAAAYRSDTASEGYHCRYGLNPAFRAALLTGPLRVAAEDEAGEVRAIELVDHPFFVATLFQPERAALRGERVALVDAFVQASAG
jgi:CTP synthase (UTP-ammonia lyase)